MARQQVQEQTDDLLARMRGEITARMEELRPVVAEYEQLTAAEQALAGAIEPPKRGPGRPKSWVGGGSY